jgi:hypothetical protein
MAQEKSRLLNIFVTDDKSWVFQNDAATEKKKKLPVTKFVSATKEGKLSC